MNYRPIIYPYKPGSKSARALSQELRSRGFRAKRVRPNGNYRPYRNHLIINWGSSNAPEFLNKPVTGIGTILNLYQRVSNAANKLLCFEILEDAGVSIPEYTEDFDIAHEWLETGSILARTTLTGHSGAGIHFVQQGEDIAFGMDIASPVRLFVKYIKKKYEYRVHVFRGEVIDIQQKRTKTDTPNEEIDYQIRSYKNGWIFARDNIYLPCPSIKDQAIAAVTALGIDFGAVDIIWNEKKKKAYVLEVNTAPGLEGTTLIKYTEAIHNLIRTL